MMTRYSAEKTKANLVRLIRGDEGGEAAWFYLLLDRLKAPLFERAIKSGRVRLKDFGEILCTGWGENPPQDISREIEARFSN